MKSHSIRRAFVSLAASCAVLLSLTGCGSGDPSGTGGTDAAGGAGDGELTPVSVGVIPIGDVASIYVGQQEGIFEKHGIDLTLTQAQGGAAVVPGVQSGDLDFGYSNATSLIVARDQGLPIKMVATGPQSTGDPDDDFAAIMVKEDSDIESLADLEGKTVAVNTLNNIFDSLLYEGMHQEGLDRDSIELAEMGFGDMVPNLDRGTVDAIAAVDPFATIGDEQGMKRIYGVFAEPIENLSIGGYFTTESKIEQEPELVEAFTAAMKESQELADNNPDIVREVIAEYTTTEPEILEKTTLPRFPAEHDRESLQKLMEASLDNGLIDNEVPVDDLLTDDA